MNVSLCVCVEEGDHPVLVVQEDAHFLRGLFEVDSDGGAGADTQVATFPPADRPVTAAGSHLDGPLPVDGLPGNAQIPVCFITNLKRRVTEQ